MLYTEPPRLDTLDWGWFCREHAFHTYLLAKLFRFDAKLKVGHLAIGFPERHQSVIPDVNHAWCEVQSVSPIDLSAEFSKFPHFPNLVRPVLGQGTNGAFEVRQFTKHEEFDFEMNSRRNAFSLNYLEFEFTAPSDEILVRNPSKFLLASNPECLVNTHGPRLFAGITLHLRDVVLGHANPWFKTHDPKSVVRLLDEREFKGAVPSLLELL